MYMLVIGNINTIENGRRVQHVYNDMYNMVSEILTKNSVIDRR